jgi:hypothetical protein
MVGSRTWRRRACILPASCEAKYKAKAAVDTFFVRIGDVILAGMVFVGTKPARSVSGFAAVRVGLTMVWLLLVLAIYIYREPKRRIPDVACAQGRGTAVLRACRPTGICQLERNVLSRIHQTGGEVLLFFLCFRRRRRGGGFENALHAVKGRRQHAGQILERQSTQKLVVGMQGLERDVQRFPRYVSV